MLDDSASIRRDARYSSCTYRELTNRNITSVLLPINPSPVLSLASTLIPFRLFIPFGSNSKVPRVPRPTIHWYTRTKVNPRTSQPRAHLLDRLKGSLQSRLSTPRRDPAINVQRRRESRRSRVGTDTASVASQHTTPASCAAERRCRWLAHPADAWDARWQLLVLWRRAARGLQRTRVRGLIFCAEA